MAEEYIPPTNAQIHGQLLAAQLVLAETLTLVLSQGPKDHGTKHLLNLGDRHKALFRGISDAQVQEAAQNYSRDTLNRAIEALRKIGK